LNIQNIKICYNLFIRKCQEYELSYWSLRRDSQQNKGLHVLDSPAFLRVDKGFQVLHLPLFFMLFKRVDKGLHVLDSPLF